jgi:voltage-gated potassium channel
MAAARQPGAEPSLRRWGVRAAPGDHTNPEAPGYVTGPTRKTRLRARLSGPSRLRLLTRFRLPLVLLVVAVAYGVAGYRLLEGWSLLDALYMTVITLAAVGFAEVHPLGPAGRIFTISLITLGVAALFFTLQAATELVASGQLVQSVRRRRMDTRIKRLDRHYVICAFGRVGRAVAEELARQGLPYVVVEQDPALLGQLEERGVPHLLADPTAEKVLRRAGVERAIGLVCAVDSDAVNVYITLTARALNPSLTIVARASNPGSVDKLTRAGADQVVSPYVLSGHRMAFLAQHPAVVDFLDLVGIAPDLKLEEIKVRPGSALDGATTGAACAAHRGATILAVKRPGVEPVAFPGPDVRLEAEDLVVALGPMDALDAMSR